MNKIITISREFGSGGKELGKKLAETLGMDFYDGEIIDILAKETGMDANFIKTMDESIINNYTFKFANSFVQYSNAQSSKIDLLVHQQKVIKEIAKKGNCIIVGRGADVILQEFNPLRLFVYANLESKLKRCLENRNEEEKLNEKQMVKKIKRIDKSRKKYYDILSNQSWGIKENYDLCINTSNIIIEDIITPLVGYINNWFEEDK